MVYGLKASIGLQLGLQVNYGVPQLLIHIIAAAVAPLSVSGLGSFFGKSRKAEDRKVAVYKRVTCGKLAVACLQASDHRSYLCS